jgi:hypothetical protein
VSRNFFCDGYGSISVLGIGLHDILQFGQVREAWRRMRIIYTDVN